MNIESEYNMGPQPIAEIMDQHNLRSHDLVAASTQQLTHKMVSRACKGRKLSRRVQLKILSALSTIINENYTLKDLFTY